MKCGLITEGKSDQAVLTNILKGQIGLESNDIVYLQPESFFDETDLNDPKYIMNKKKFSNWELVKSECISKEKMSDFFDNPIDDKRFLIIQIDTAEAHLDNYGVIKPEKKNNYNYTIDLINKTEIKLNEWLGEVDYNIVNAICVEETEAWILTIYLKDNKDTSMYNTPKEKLNYLISLDDRISKKLRNKNSFNQNLELTKPFTKKKELKKYLLKNKSLEYFCDLLDKMHSKLEAYQH